MKQLSFLLALTMPLAASAGALAAEPTVVGGAVVGKVAPETRLSAWIVTPFGQPLQQVGDTAFADGKFALQLPVAPPADRLQFPIGERTAWPGLVDFAGTSTPATAAELKFFIYADANRNGQRDEAEPLREVRIDQGKGELFVVWAKTPVVVKGGSGYQADLKAGWNVMVVEVRKVVKVAPYGGTPLQVDLNR